MALYRYALDSYAATCAGMVAAGEMNVEGGIDHNARLDPVADLGGVALGI